MAEAAQLTSEQNLPKMGQSALLVDKATCPGPPFNMLSTQQIYVEGHKNQVPMTRYPSSASTISMESSPGEGVDFHHIKIRTHPNASSPPNLSTPVPDANILATKPAHGHKVTLLNATGSVAPASTAKSTFSAVVKRNLPKDSSPQSDLSLLFPQKCVGGKYGALKHSGPQPGQRTLYSKMPSSPSETGSLWVSPGNRAQFGKSTLPRDLIHVPSPSLRAIQDDSEEERHFINIFEKDSDGKTKRIASDNRNAALASTNSGQHGIRNVEEPHTSQSRAVLRVTRGVGKMDKKRQEAEANGSRKEFEDKYAKLQDDKKTNIRMTSDNAPNRQSNLSVNSLRNVHHSNVDDRGLETEGNPVNPLNDIKLWSIEYFEHHDPSLAAEIAIHSKKERSKQSPELSQADTRSLSDTSELVVYHADNFGTTQHAKWLEFVGQRNLPHEKCLPDLPVGIQLSDWDGDFVVPSRDMFESVCWSIGHDVAENIDRWIDINVDLKHRFSVPTTASTFETGESRPSGLFHNRLVWPADAIFDSLDPDFDPINWNNIPVLSSPYDEVLSPFQRHQSSELCRRIIMAPYQKLVAKMEMQRSRTNVDRAKRGARKRPDGKQIREPTKVQKTHDAWIPSANFYVRPARHSDASQLCSIYNAWVDGSAVTKDLMHRERPHFEDAVAERRQVGLPFLVAVAKSAQNIRHMHFGRLSRNVSLPQYQLTHDGGTHLDRQERVLGFVFTDPVNGILGEAFRGVIELQLFTDPQYLRQGIGKTLLDQALALMIPFYLPNAGTEFAYDHHTDGIHYKFGAFSSPSAIRKILIQLLWEPKDSHDFEWKKKMLEEKFIFRQASFFANLGEKDNQPVHLATFVRDTCNGAEG